MAIFGINVSSGNGEIDHGELRRGRVGFANVRVTAGLRTDPRAAWNLEGFRKNGIPTGVIHEFRAQDLMEAVAESDYFANELKTIGETPKLYTICRLEKGEMTDAKLISTFFDRLTRQISANPCVMGSREQLEAIDKGLKKLGAELKIAYWSVDESEQKGSYYICNDERELPCAVGRQFREFGAIEGCKGVFEQNFGYEELAELLFFAKCGEDECTERFVERARKMNRQNQQIGGENTNNLRPESKIIMKLAERMCSNRLSATPKPLRLLSYEKQLLIVRWQCGLTPEEIGELNRMPCAPEVVRRVCKAILG